MMWRILQIEENDILADVDNILRDQHNSANNTKANSIIVLLFIQNIPQQTLPPRRLFDLFLGTVSGYKPMFFCFSLRCSSKRR